MKSDPFLEQMFELIGPERVNAALDDPSLMPALVKEVSAIINSPATKKAKRDMIAVGQRAVAKTLIQPPALDHALYTCLRARKLIPAEQDRLRVLLADETDQIKRDYIEYQIDLVAWQLTRAAESAETRLRYYHAITDWAAEKVKCASDIIHWFNQWAWTLDPRQSSPLAVVPFSLFPFQVDTLHWLDKLVMIQRASGVVEKSRDQGWTWISTGWSTYHWQYTPNFQVLFGSKNEDAVDSMEEPDTILEKVRFQVRMLPVQLLPAQFDYKAHMGYMKIVNPENKAVISGEAPTINFGRSGRYSAIIFDEHAAMPHNGRPQWTAASRSSDSLISASTPQGTLTRQAELAKSGLPKLTLHWKLHPWRDLRWYNALSQSMDDQEIAQEVDIDYEASQPGLVYGSLWDKQYHVIKWSEFKRLFGVAHKPHSWPAAIYQDVGTSADHPTATGWYTRPTERDGHLSLTIDGVAHTYDLTDMAVMYRTMTVFDEEIGDIWDKMCLLMRPAQERDMLKTYRMSHEAESERKTLRKNGATPAPVHWKAGKTRGIAEMKSALKLIDTSKPNPFRPWLMGRPRFIALVADDQYDEPVDDFGMARFQSEIAAYHFPKQVLGEPVKAQAPYAFYNDQADQNRIAAADGFVPLVGLTANEQRERQLRPEIRIESIVEETHPDILQAKIQSRDLYLRRLAAANVPSRHIKAGPSVRFRR